MSEALGLLTRGAKLHVSEPERVGRQTDMSDAYTCRALQTTREQRQTRQQPPTYLPEAQYHA